MSCEWETVPLGRLVEEGRGISYGIVQPGAEVSGGVPIVRVGDVRNGRVSVAAPLRVHPDVAAAYGRTRLSGGELLITLVGTVGETAVVPPSLAGWNTARAVAVVPVRPEVGARWVQLALRSPRVRAIIGSRVNTTVQTTLNLRDVAELPVVLPPHEARTRILRVADAIDAKIDHNDSLTERLRSLSSALLHRGLSAGYEEVALGEIADVIDCLHSKKPERVPDGAPLLQLENIRSDGLLDMSTSYGISQTDYTSWTRRMEASEGDCVITNVGRVGAVARIPAGVRAALGRNMTGLRLYPDFPYPAFLIESLTSPYFRREIELLTDAGTVMNALNVRNIPKLKIRIPSGNALDDFEHVAAATWRLREQLVQETSRLRSLDEMILPRLLTGDLSVRDSGALEVVTAA